MVCSAVYDGRCVRPTSCSRPPAGTPRRRPPRAAPGPRSRRVVEGLQHVVEQVREAAPGPDPAPVATRALAARHPLDSVGQPYGRVLRQTAARNPSRDALVFPQFNVRQNWRQFDAAVDLARGVDGLAHAATGIATGALARRHRSSARPTTWSDVLPSTTTQNSSPPLRPPGSWAAARPTQPAARRSGPVPGRRPRARGRR